MPLTARLLAVSYEAARRPVFEAINFSCIANVQVTEGGTRYICTGSTGTGNVLRANGATKRISFALERDYMQFIGFGGRCEYWHTPHPIFK